MKQANNNVADVKACPSQHCCFSSGCCFDWSALGAARVCVGCCHHRPGCHRAKAVGLLEQGHSLHVAPASTGLHGVLRPAALSPVCLQRFCSCSLPNAVLSSKLDVLALQATLPMRTFNNLKTTWQKRVEPSLTAAERRRVPQMLGTSSSASTTQLPQVTVNSEATRLAVGAQQAMLMLSAINREMQHTGMRSALLTCAGHQGPCAGRNPVLIHAELCTSSMLAA